MNGFLTVLPLAFVMIAGPQIISSVFLATSVDWVRNSLAYVVGAAISVTVFTTVAFVVVQGAKGTSAARSAGTEGKLIDVVLIVLLLALAFLVFRNRKESEPPKWMGKLQEAKPRFSFTLGLLLLGIFPTDIITSVTVGTKVAREGEPWSHILGFVALTLLLLAVPALLVLAMGKRAQTFLPRVREWMNTNSWIISELVIALFLGIEINSLVQG